MCAFKVALDGNEVLWICEFGFSPGCCPGEHKAPSVALALLGSGDNMCVAVPSIVPFGMVAAVGGIGSS